MLDHLSRYARRYLGGDVMATSDDKRERRRFWREFGLKVLDIVGRLVGNRPARGQS